MEPRIVREWLPSSFGSKLAEMIHMSSGESKDQILSFAIDNLDPQKPLESSLSNLAQRFSEILPLDQVQIRIVETLDIEPSLSIGVYLPLGKGTLYANGIQHHFDYRDFIVVRDPIELRFESTPIGGSFYLVNFYQTSDLEGLPLEVRSNIASFLSLTDIQNLRATSSRTNAVLSLPEANAKVCGLIGTTEIELPRFLMTWNSRRIPLDCVKYINETLGVKPTEFGFVYPGFLISQLELANLPVLEYVFAYGVNLDFISGYNIRSIDAMIENPINRSLIKPVLELLRSKGLRTWKIIEALSTAAGQGLEVFKIVDDFIRGDVDLDRLLSIYRRSFRVAALHCDQQVLDYIIVQGFDFKTKGHKLREETKVYNQALVDLAIRDCLEVFNHLLDVAFNKFDMKSDFVSRAFTDLLFEGDSIEYARKLNLGHPNISPDAMNENPYLDQDRVDSLFQRIQEYNLTEKQLKNLRGSLYQLDFEV